MTYTTAVQQILKKCNSLISKPLSYICNKSIQTGVFPDHFKYASAKPLFMRIGPVYQITDLFLYYWFFSKILEKTTYSGLNQHLCINNILAMEQYRFRKDWSTEHAAYTLINGILQAWNNKLQVVGIFFLPKTFNCVNHDILIEKLKYYGVNETGVY
jgi:hypothetical protein